MENEAAENALTYLKHVLQGIGRLFPSSHEMLMPGPHEKIEVLILFPGYDAIVMDSLLVASHHAPPVTMESFQERQTGTINPTVRIERHVGKWDDFDL